MKRLVASFLVIGIIFSLTGCKEGEPIDNPTTQQIINTAIDSVASPSSMQVDATMDISITTGKNKKSHLIMKSNMCYQNTPWIQKMDTQFIMNDEEMKTLGSSIYLTKEGEQPYVYMKAQAMSKWNKSAVSQEQFDAYLNIDASTLDISLFHENEDEFREVDPEVIDANTYMVLEGELSEDCIKEVSGGLANTALFMDIDKDMMSTITDSIDVLPVTIKINQKSKQLYSISLDISDFMQKLLDNTNEQLENDEDLMDGECESATMTLIYKNIGNAPKITLPQM